MASQDVGSQGNYRGNTMGTPALHPWRCRELLLAPTAAMGMEQAAGGAREGALPEGQGGLAMGESKKGTVLKG